MNEELNQEVAQDAKVNEVAMTVEEALTKEDVNSPEVDTTATIAMANEAVDETTPQPEEQPEDEVTKLRRQMKTMFEQYKQLQQAYLEVRGLVESKQIDYLMDIAKNKNSYTTTLHSKAIAALDNILFGVIESRGTEPKDN